VVVIEPQPAPPRTRVPGIVTVREYVGHAEDAAVILLEIRAFSQGCLLEFVSAARGASPDAAAPRFTVDFGQAPTAEAPRLVRPLSDEASGAPRLWISPLPPVEGFTLVTDWPEYGIVGQRARVGGENLRLAAWDSFPCLPAGLR